jgi:hypothetical protein
MFGRLMADFTPSSDPTARGRSGVRRMLAGVLVVVAVFAVFAVPKIQEHRAHRAQAAYDTWDRCALDALYGDGAASARAPLPKGPLHPAPFAANADLPWAPPEASTKPAPAPAHRAMSVEEWEKDWSTMNTLVGLMERQEATCGPEPADPRTEAWLAATAPSGGD